MSREHHLANAEHMRGSDRHREECSIGKARGVASAFADSAAAQALAPAEPTLAQQEQALQDVGVVSAFRLSAAANYRQPSCIHAGFQL